jgi:hypothetical protein
MKVGLSYSRCVKDIVEGRVDINDVLIIISRTDFNPNDDNQWKGIWNGYRGVAGSNPEWIEFGDDDENRFRAVSMMLYNDGKLHQPRKFGAYPRRRPEYWLETFLPDSELENNPTLKKAWDDFQLLAGLVGAKNQLDYQ